ncbi:hypothetical protein [Sulfuricurvum sp.]|uniref:hypothetical protein n=1 Tax=Sulfuricurvum sp. TaxID=2025608 RepID=UPI002D352DDB|nr:hypothetical protein [Sulfuricurvum sp.]HZF71125.1 hypothetical protein [Sulfuricurvum sp.]
MIRKPFSLLLLFIMTGSALLGTETMIFIRHAEKPADGLGQLSCKGLNRSLKLPETILKRFGEPDYLIAPNPTVQKPDKGVSYNYLRPLATIEPLAIRISKNINLTCGYDEIDCMADLLMKHKYKNDLILIAWEHHNIDKIIKKIAKSKEVKIDIPEWASDDFDSMYILKLEKNSLELKIEKQGLNNQNASCGL